LHPQGIARSCHILSQHGWSTALVVTDRYHLPRALLVFRSLGIQACGSAPKGRPYARKRWQRWYSRGREVFALAWYVVRVLGLKMRRLCHNPEAM
jgi:uncharacterized SAM-binding protein YcdF (DUF218 family)